MKSSNTSDTKNRIICTVINDLTTDQRMHRICDSLVRAGYEVTLVGRELPSSKLLQSRSFSQKRLKCIFHKGFLFYMEYNIRLMWWMMFQKADIINAIDLDTIVPAWLVARLKGKKVVYDAHEWFPYCPEIIERPKVHKFWLQIENIFVPKMDKVYTVSQSIAQELSQAYHQEVGLVRNMPVKRIAQSNKTASYILYQGALNIGRGIEELIEAMPFIEMPLYIAGQGDIEKELKQKVINLNLQDKVKFLGQLTPDELWTYTQNAFIGVNLLQNLGLNYYYSLANKFFDYVQADVPQISMDFPEYRLMNKQYEVAVLIKDLQTQTIVKAISELIQNPQHYTHLQEQCRQAKNIWNWEEEQKNLLNIYEQL